MELKRRVGDRLSVVLLLVGNLACAVTFSGVNNTIGQTLECTNDFVNLMFCAFEAHNCAKYNVTLRMNSEPFEQVHCIPNQCDGGRCCCLTQMLLVRGETHTATVWKGGESMGFKIISIRESIKPRAPTITSVGKSNGNIQLMWTTNMVGSFSNNSTFNVTYHKKGDTEKVSKFVRPSTAGGFYYYEILGQHLEPSTTYMVSVKTYTDWSDRFSDSSKEVEFTTPASPRSLIAAVIISLSMAAVIISGAIYSCYVKLKAKWWDTVARCPNPKLLIMHLSEKEVLKPVPPVISTMCVEPPLLDDGKPWSKGSLTDSSSGSRQQSSGIGTGPLASISPVLPLTTNPLADVNKDGGLVSAPYDLCGVRADGMSSGSSGFVNKTYSILIPSFLHQISSEVQTQPEMLCESAYHPSEGDIVICADQEVPACPLVTSPPLGSSLIATDMSYQQCNADSGRFSYAGDSSLSSMSSGSNTLASCDPASRVEAGCERSSEVIGGATVLNVKTGEATVCDEKPLYGCVPAGSHSFPVSCVTVDDDYQAFQNLVDQPDVFFSERRSGEEEERSSKYPEGSFTEMPQIFSSPAVPDFTNNVQGGQAPFLSLFSAESALVMTDGGYQSV